MKNRIMTTLAVSMFASSILGASTVLAENKKPEAKPPTREMRQKMAEVHTKMAECLNSEKPMSECRSEMMKSCQQMMGQGGCSMMEQKGGHMGNMMMGPGMMDHKDEKSH